MPITKVSVILTTRNRSNFLRPAIQSLLEQKLCNYEIMVVDDASTDDTRSAVKSFKDKRVKYIYTAQNLGPVKCRKRALEAACGKYIMYTDDDAIMYPDYLSAPSEYLDSHKNTDIVYADCHFSLPGKKDFVPYSVDFNKNRLELENYVPGFCFMHQRDCLNEINGWKESAILRRNGMQDWDLILQLSDKFRFKHIRKVIARHIYHDENLSCKQRHYLSYAYIINKRLQILKASYGSAVFRGYFVSVIEIFYHRFAGTLEKGAGIIGAMFASFPEEPEVYVAASLHYIRSKNLRKAEACLSDAIKLSRDHPQKNLIMLNTDMLRLYLKYRVSGKIFWTDFNNHILNSITSRDDLNSVLTQAVRRFIRHDYVQLSKE